MRTTIINRCTDSAADATSRHTNKVLLSIYCGLKVAEDLGQIGNTSFDVLRFFVTLICNVLAELNLGVVLDHLLLLLLLLLWSIDNPRALVLTIVIYGGAICRIRVVIVGNILVTDKRLRFETRRRLLVVALLASTTYQTTNSGVG
jgi:hypothetical protein